MINTKFLSINSQLFFKIHTDHTFNWKKEKLLKEKTVQCIYTFPQTLTSIHSWDYLS